MLVKIDRSVKEPEVVAKKLGEKGHQVIKVGWADVAFMELQGGYADLVVTQRLKSQAGKVIAMREPNRFPPAIEGYRWKAKPGPWERWTRNVMLEKVEEEPWVGDWTLPGPVWSQEDAMYVGWNPTTWVSVKELRQLPEKLLGKVKVWQKDKKWWKDPLAPYFTLDVDGQPISNVVRGSTIVRESQNPRESFQISVAFWPLKYVPTKYLIWLVSDGWYKKWEPITDNLSVWHWEFQPCEGVLREKILEYLKTPEVKAWEERTYDLMKKEVEWKGFYGTGVWDGGEVQVATFRYMKGIDAGGKKEWEETSRYQERFLDLGTSYKHRWGSLALTRLDAAEARYEDEDPDAPEQKDGPGNDHSRWIMKDGKEKKKPRSERDKARRLLQILDQLEAMRVRFRKKNGIQKRQGVLNVWERWEDREDRVDARWRLYLMQQDWMTNLGGWDPMDSLVREGLQQALQEVNGGGEESEAMEEDRVSEEQTETLPWKVPEWEGELEKKCDRGIGWEIRVARGQIRSEADKKRRPWS